MVYLGNAEKFKGAGLVAFLDILGFAKEIESKWDSTSDNPLEKILELKENLPVFIRDQSEDNKDVHKRRYSCRVQTVSDSIIVSFGFEEKPVLGDMILGTMAFFDTMSMIWWNTLQAGFTLRGAADFGSIYWNEKEIIGPAFINAYRLEQNTAKTSRIIISSALNKNLAKIFGQSQTFWNDDILKTLRKDIDGFIILNPHTLYDTEAEKAILHDIILDLQEKAQGLNKDKYSPLLACLNSQNQSLESADLGKY